MEFVKSPLERFLHLDKFRHLVVHCKKSPFDVYIGRDCRGMPSGHQARWGNPFVMANQSEEERYRVTAEYEAWVRAQPELVAAARAELQGKVLGCYCSPLMCHGRVLASIANDEDTHSTSEVTTGPAASAVVADDDVAPLTKQQLRNRARRQKKREEKASSHAAPGGKVEGVVKGTQDSPNTVGVTVEAGGYIDIGINITNRELKREWKAVVQRAVAAEVRTVVLTGTTVQNTEESIRYAHLWFEQEGSRTMRCTAGVHPHYAKTFNAQTYSKLKALLNDPFVTAVGECGLDFNRNLSSRVEQIHAFREQVRLGCETGYPLFVHEREAHAALLEVLDDFTGRLPPLVVHCFTGTAAEAAEYIRRGYYIGFTGTVCKKERGAPLRALLPRIPLDRIMIETDAPYMGFLKTRRSSEPADVVLVAAEIARCLSADTSAVREATTRNATRFFRL